jgi:hypothetical protein
MDTSAMPIITCSSDTRLSRIAWVNWTPMAPPITTCPTVRP